MWAAMTLGIWYCGDIGDLVALVRSSGVNGYSATRVEVIESLQKMMESSLRKFIEFCKIPPRRVVFFLVVIVTEILMMSCLQLFCLQICQLFFSQT